MIDKLNRSNFIPQPSRKCRIGATDEAARTAPIGRGSDRPVEPFCLARRFYGACVRQLLACGLVVIAMTACSGDNSKKVQVPAECSQSGINGSQLDPASGPFFFDC